MFCFSWGLSRKLLSQALNPRFPCSHANRKLLSNAGRNQHLVVCTGGGPGFMEAANKGASRVEGARNMGMGITLPFEEGKRCACIYRFGVSFWAWARHSPAVADVTSHVSLSGSRRRRLVRTFMELATPTETSNRNIQQKHPRTRRRESHRQKSAYTCRGRWSVWQ